MLIAAKVLRPSVRYNLMSAPLIERLEIQTWF
jgi:hypothetical protein